MKTDKSWMKINIKKFWMFAVCNQILIFLMKETKPKLVNEELIYQARAHHVSRILQKEIRNRISGQFDGVIKSDI